jgi:hypothetical protein
VEGPREMMLAAGALGAAALVALAGVAPPPMPPHSPLGILNATEYGVDASGASDTTAQLQAAIVAAYDAQLALFLPPGRYLVSDTLWANQSNYGSSLPVNMRPARWRTNVLLGSAAAAARPTIVLAPHSNGFGDAKAPKNVVKLHNTGRENDHMNQIFRSIDIEIGEGNPGAVGVFLHGAQGSTVQDVTVRMVDALAGFGGGGGAGASHINIAAVGGKFGVRFDESEPGPVVVGGRFVNQSVSGVAWIESSHNSAGQGPLIITGVEIIQPAGASGPAIDSPALYAIDAVITCAGSTGVATAPGAYLRSIFTKGCALKSGEEQGPTDSYALVHEMAEGTIWVDGQSHQGANMSNISSQLVATPPDVIGRHVPSERWNEKTFPSLERTETANGVRDCHATGDGVTDDTAALQSCLDTHLEVFLPKGLYRISKTLQMQPGGALVGLSQTHSVIAPMTTGFAAAAAASASSSSSASAAADEPVPLLRTQPGSSVTVAFLGLVTWWHVPSVFTLEWRSTQGIWRSNYESRVCECMWLSDYGSPNAAHGKFGTWPPSNCTAGVNLTVPKTQIHGTGKFYNYVSDEDVLFTDHVGYRDVLVANNSISASDRLAFYAINLEHSMAEANGEFNQAAHVDVFGLKKEGSTSILWIRDSTDISLFGTAGGYTALSKASEYPADFQPYVPSIYRVERTSPLKLAITAYGAHQSDEMQEGEEEEEEEDDALLREGRATETKAHCSFPLDATQLTQGNFPHVDWPALTRSLWIGWCGNHDAAANVLVEADGPKRTIVATKDPGVLYLRGYDYPRGA